MIDLPGDKEGDASKLTALQQIRSQTCASGTPLSTLGIDAAGIKHGTNELGNIHGCARICKLMRRRLVTLVKSIGVKGVRTEMLARARQIY